MATIRRIRTLWSGVAGTPWYTNMFFTRVVGTEDAAIEAVADFWNAMDLYIKSTVTWDVQEQIDLLDDVTGNLVGTEGGTGISGAGSASDELLPPSNQMLVNWFTDAFAGGRRIRGKTYVPGLTQLGNEAGVPSALALSALGTAASQLIIDTSSSGPLRVYSRRNARSDVVTNRGVYSQFAVLRSRRD